MGELVDHFGASLTATLPPPSSDLSAATNVELLVSATGSGRAAARYLGVAESTLRGWRKGVRPKGDRNQEIAAAARAALVNRTVLRGAKSGELELSMQLIGVRVSSDIRDRTVHPGRYIPKRTMQRIIRMWERAEPDDKVEAALIRAINQYYTPISWLQVEQVYWS